MNVAPIHKSLLGALYGIAVSEERVDRDNSLDALVIDDQNSALTEAEKQAIVRDLLTAMSGAYHPATHETGEIRRNMPERESHSPDTF